MSEWLSQAFSGGVSLSRANPAGLLLMALAVALLCMIRPLSGRFLEKKREGAAAALRIAALLICAAGAIVSII